MSATAMLDDWSGLASWELSLGRCQYQTMLLIGGEIKSMKCLPLNLPNESSAMFIICKWQDKGRLSVTLTYFVLIGSSRIAFNKQQSILQTSGPGYDGNTVALLLPILFFYCYNSYRHNFGHCLRSILIFFVELYCDSLSKRTRLWWYFVEKYVW